MFDLAKTYGPNYQCREDETYETMMENGGEPFKCGSPLTAYIFFILFMILVSQVFINLFIAIIIDAFLGQTDHFKLPVQKYSINEFVSIWSKYDEQATGFIDINDLEPLIKDLVNSDEGVELLVLDDPKLKDYFDKFILRLRASKKYRQLFGAKLGIPTYMQLKKVMFYDTL